MKIGAQVIGMVLLVVGAQDAIRLLFDHDRGGVFGRLPGGFAGHLAYGIAAVVLGLALASWATRKPVGEPEPDAADRQPGASG
jgi:hypothetical protein